MNVIDIRDLLLWRAEEDMFLAHVNELVYDYRRALNRAQRIRQGIGFR